MWSNQVKEYHPSLYIGEVVIEKGGFGLPSTKVANFTFYLLTFLIIYALEEQACL